MNRFGIVNKAVRDSVKVATWNYDILDSVANSVANSVRNYIGSTVWNPIKNSVYISVQNSVEDYFQTNSNIIKQ